MLDPRAIQIHTDGSCYAQHKRISGCAAIVLYPDSSQEQIVDYGCEESTNIRMELMAVVKGLEWAITNQPWPDVNRIYIVTDLEFIVRCYSSARFWKQNGWRTSSGEPIAHEDLWDSILKSVQKLSKVGIRIDFHWTPGKKDAIGKLIDKAAKTAAQRGGYDKDLGYKPGSHARSMVPGGATAKKFEAAGQQLVIRPYMKKVRHKREEKVYFNIFDEHTQAYNSKYFAYAEPLLSAELHRGNGYRVRFNADLAFPIILQILENVPLPKPKSRTP